MPRSSAFPARAPSVDPYNTLVRVAGQLEGLPHRYGAHPSAYTFSFYGPGALAWLLAQWVSAGRPGHRRAFRSRTSPRGSRSGARADSRSGASCCDSVECAVAGGLLNPESDVGGESNGSSDPTDNGGPVIALQWGKQALESLSLERLDISPSAAMATASSACALGEDDPATTAAAWRLLETGDTLSISQVESVGMRMLLRRARELAELQSQGGRALGSIEHLAQLLSLWKPGAYNKEHEQAHFDARFAARERPSYPDPSMAAVLDPTSGRVL